MDLSCHCNSASRGPSAVAALVVINGQILEAYNTGVEAFRQHKSDGLTADRIDSTMLNVEEVILRRSFSGLELSVHVLSGHKPE